MSVDIGRVIEEGGRRTIARNGLILVVIAWVLGVLRGFFGSAVIRGIVGQLPGQAGPQGMPFGPGTMGPSLGLGPGTAGILSAIVWLVTLFLVGAAYRTFVTDDTETLPVDRFTRDGGWMWINLLVGWIVFWIVVGIGLILIVVPGVFLAVSLLFFGVYVAAEGENFWTAFQSSWALSKGNRLMLFVTGVVVVIISAIIEWVFGLALALGGTLGLVIGQIGAAFALVFTLATIARAYVQLTEQAAAEPEPAATEDADVVEE